MTTRRDTELRAIVRILNILEELSRSGRGRVLDYVVDRIDAESTEREDEAPELPLGPQPVELSPAAQVEVIATVPERRLRTRRADPPVTGAFGGDPDSKPSAA